MAPRALGGAFVGILLYFFFGQNTRKERLISERSLSQLTKRSMFEYIEQKGSARKSTDR